MKCFVSGDTDCRSGRAVYRVCCQTCQNDPEKPPNVLYIGTTGFLAHKRFLEHSAALRTASLKNAIAKHENMHHAQNRGEYVGEIIEGSIKFNLERFVTEAIQIEKAKRSADTMLLNQKGEWGHFGVTRLQVVNE